MSGQNNGGREPRAVAVVGPYGSGKTTLLESILAITGAVQRKGQVAQKNTVGDFSPEARARQMSVEVNCATTRYLDQTFTFLDCPGSIEFLSDALNVLPGVDAAIVVCEPEPAKLQMLQPYLKRLADMKIPHLLFVNKIDKASGSLRALLTMLQDASDMPLLLRQIPIWENDVVTGFVDLALERAYIYRPNDASEIVDIADKDSEKQARFAMLEKLADYDEHLMEELLLDVEPPKEEVFGDLAKELAQGLVVPVLIGSAEGDNGIRRLLKALRHEVPPVSAAAKRLGLETNGDAVVQILKTYHSSHGGKLSLARVLAGTLKDGALLRRADGGEARVGGIFALKGEAQTKLAEALAGDSVALGRLEGVATGETLAVGKTKLPKVAIERLTPVYRLGIEATDRKDEVKLTSAIAKLREEDPSLIFDQNAQLQEMALVGQGEIHLKVAVEKLQSKYGLKLRVRAPRIPYKETIRKAVAQHGRHKRQSGGHGQFGDVHLDIRPLPRGTGFVFEDKIKGGVVPRQWIPSVEKGVADYLKCGPLGFPVVDVAVALTDGSYHAVDSSDAAFQTAARIAMTEGMPNCAPVLLESIMHVKIHVRARRRPKSMRWSAAGAASSWGSTRAPAGRAGTRWRRRCRWRNSPTSSSTCAH
ncbi:MAG: elongation factor G [Rhizomicrobium sp.]